MASDPDDSVSEAYDADNSVENVVVVGPIPTGVNNGATLDTSRSDHVMTERDDDPTEPSGTKSLVKRKGVKGINHFSFCDRATQTTVPPIRVITLSSLLIITF